MAEQITGFTRFRIGAAAIGWFILIVLFALALPVLLVWPWIVVIGVGLLGLLIGLVVFAILWLIVRKRPDASRGRLLRRTLPFGIMLATVLFAAPIYILTILIEDDPAVVPLATLSNGKKTVVFQGMMHVGSEGFYKSVVYDLEKALDDGYVLFYEGVSGGTPENKKWLDTLVTGGKDLNGSYQFFADTCGLKFQLNYMGIVQKGVTSDPARHIVADVSEDDMRAEYDRLVAADPAYAEAVSAGNGDDVSSSALEWVSTWLEKATDSQRGMTGLVCRGLMNMGLKRSESGPLDKVILDFRNRKLAEKIAAYPGDRIYITYGAKHLPGVLADLQAIDPAWAITAERWVRTIASQ